MSQKGAETKTYTLRGCYTSSRIEEVRRALQDTQINKVVLATDVSFIAQASIALPETSIIPAIHALDKLLRGTVQI